MNKTINILAKIEKQQLNNVPKCCMWNEILYLGVICIIGFNRLLWQGQQQKELHYCKKCYFYPYIFIFSIHTISNNNNLVLFFIPLVRANITKISRSPDFPPCNTIAHFWKVNMQRNKAALELHERSESLEKDYPNRPLALVDIENKKVGYDLNIFVKVCLR